jgi:putative flippase GtrA
LRDGRRRLRKFGLRYSKFSVVGMANGAVDLVVLNLLFFAYPTRVPWLFATYNLVALVCANVSSYFLNTRWTFKEWARHDLRQRVLFVLQALVNVGVSNVLFWVAVRTVFGYTSISAFAGGNLAKIASTTVTSLLAYFMLRHLVFSPRRRFGGRL